MRELRSADEIAAIIPEGEVYTLKPWDDGSSPEKIYRS